MGRKVWIGRVEPTRFESHFREIERIDRALAERQTSLTESRARVLALQARLDEVRLRRKNLQRPRDVGGEADASALRETKHEEIGLKKEMKALKRRIEAGQSETWRLESDKTSRFRSLGEIADELRMANEDFAGLYSQIDKINRTIVTYLDQIDELK